MVSLDGRHPNIPEMAEPDAHPSAPSNGDSSRVCRQRPMLVKQTSSLFSDSVSSDYSADSHATDFYRCSSSRSDISDTDNLGNDESQRLLATPSDGMESKDVIPGLGNDQFQIDEDSQTDRLQLEGAQTRNANS